MYYMRRKIMSETYTRDGDNEYELVYDLPEEDGDVYLVPVDEHGAKATVVSLEEFESEWTEMGYDEYLAMESDKNTTAYTNERQKNGFGIN